MTCFDRWPGMGSRSVFRLQLMSISTAALLSLCATLHAAIVTIDQDMTINAANSFPEPPESEESLVVNIIDGMSGPPTVQTVEGGVIGGFVNVHGGSHLLMSGGRVEALTTIFDQATLTLSAGTIQPLIQFYDATDPAGVLRVVGAGTINLSGGTFFGRIQQHDSSVINIYGHSFVVDGELPTSTLTLSGVHVSGIYANGESFNVEITRHSPNAQVVLHTTPEPSACVLALSVALSILGLRP